MINILEGTFTGSEKHYQCNKKIANILVDYNIIPANNIRYYYDTVESITITNYISIYTGPNVSHTNGSSISLSTGSGNTATYKAIITDNGVIVNVTSDSSAFTIIVGKTISLNNDESLGIIIYNSNGYFMFTDKMNTSKTAIKDFVTTSRVITQLSPICNPDGEEYFKNIFFTFMKKNTDTGKTILNNENFYIYENIAIMYTAD